MPVFVDSGEGGVPPHLNYRKSRNWSTTSHESVDSEETASGIQDTFLDELTFDMNQPMAAAVSDEALKPESPAIDTESLQKFSISSDRNWDSEFNLWGWGEMENGWKFSVKKKREREKKREILKEKYIWQNKNGNCFLIKCLDLKNFKRKDFSQKNDFVKKNFFFKKDLINFFKWNLFRSLFLCLSCILSLSILIWNFSYNHGDK